MAKKLATLLACFVLVASSVSAKNIRCSPERFYAVNGNGVTKQPLGFLVHGILGPSADPVVPITATSSAGVNETLLSTKGKYFTYYSFQACTSTYLGYKQARYGDLNTTVYGHLTITKRSNPSGSKVKGCVTSKVDKSSPQDLVIKPCSFKDDQSQLEQFWKVTTIGPGIFLPLQFLGRKASTSPGGGAYDVVSTPKFAPSKGTDVPVKQVNWVNDASTIDEYGDVLFYVPVKPNAGLLVAEDIPEEEPI